MNSNNSPFDVSHTGFDPHQEPRLPFGNWNLSALAAPRNGGSTFGLPDTGQVLPEGRQPRMKVDAIPVIEKLMVAGMPAPNTAGVLHGAPVQFCPCGNFPRIGKQTVGITAIDTIKFFHGVEIMQFMTVQNDISSAPHPADTVQWKTYPLIACQT